MSAVLPSQASGPYEVREFELTAVTGLSTRAVDIHLELYRGYVKALNTLLAEQQAAFPVAGEPATPLDLAAQRLRLLGLEMAMQRAWLAAYIDDDEVRAARQRRNVMWTLVMSIFRTRSLWLAAFGVAAQWWGKRKARAG